jgi:GAF domain-containing protein
MTSDRVNTGARAFLKSLAIVEEGKERELIRFVVTYTGWLLLLFVWGVYLLSPELRAREAWIYGWLSVYLVYQIVVTTLGRVMKKLYETPGVRMARIQVMMGLASALVLLTGGAESYFWFVYLLPLLASALYFSWPWTWGIYSEVAVLYFLSSLVAVGGFASINFALLLTNLAVLLVLTAVLRYLVESIGKHEAAKRALEYSELLQQAQQDVDAAIDLQDVLDRILRRAVGVVEARDGSLMLMEEDGKLHFRARFGHPFPVDKEERTFTPGTADEGIAGWVVRNRKPYVCRDTETNSKFVDIIAGPSIRSLVSVPIISHGTVLGVINVDSSEPDRFSAADAESLVALANQVAVAIERAELLEGLKQIGEKTLGGAEDLHQHIVDVVHRLTRCPVSMRRVDETGKQATIVASRGVSPKYIQEAVVDLEKRSVTGKAIREREIVPVLDIQADLDFQNKEAAAREGWQSYLAVPLLAGPKHAIGTLSIYSKIKREEFIPWELDLLRAFASQAGVAIQNSALIEELKVLNEIGQAVSAEVNYQSLLELILERAKEIMPYQFGGITLIDEQSKELVSASSIGLPKRPEPLRTEIGKGIAGWVAKYGQSLRVDDVRNIPRIPNVSEQPSYIELDENTRSELCVPLKVKGQVIGVLNLESHQVGAFSERDQEQLETLASQAAIAIQNARLHADLEHHIERLQTLNEVSRELSAKLDKESIFEAVVKAIVRTLNCTHCTFFVLENNSLLPCASHSKGREAKVTRRFALGEGLAGWVAQTGQAILAHDAKKLVRFSEGKTRPEVDRSMIVLPVKVNDQVVGVISADQDLVNAFDERDLEMVETLALQTETAIQNANLLRQERQRVNAMELLREVTEKVSATLDLDEALALIVEGAMRLTETSSGVIHLIDKTGQSIARSYEFPRGFRHPNPRLSQKQSMTRTIIDNGQPIAVTDISKEPRVNPVMSEKDVKSLIGLPLKLQGEVIGVLYLNATQSRQFTSDEQSLLLTLADQAVIAIQNARLFQQATSRAAALQRLHQIGVQLLSVELSAHGLERVLRQVAQSAKSVLNADLVDVYQYIEAEDRYVIPPILEGKRRDSTIPKDIFEDDVVARVVKGGEPRYSFDAQTDSLLTGPFTVERPDRPEKRFVAREGVLSSAALPLRAAGETVGVMFVNYRIEQDFSSGQREIIELFANQAALAIHNARVFAQARARLEERLDDIRALQDIYALMGAASLEDMLEQIAEHAARLTRAKYAQVWLLDKQARELQFGAKKRLEGGTTRGLPSLSLRGSSINARVALTRKIYPCSDIADDPYYKAYYEDTRSVLTTPLIYSEKVIGTLNLESPEVGAFTDDHVRLVEALAGAVTVAIQNARLYEKIRALNEVGWVLTSGIRLREAEVLELIHSQASKLMNTDNMYIALYDEATDTVRFGLAFVDGRRVDVDNGKDWQSRKAGKGRTEWIIHNRRPILISTKAEAEAWYKQPGREEQVVGDFEPSWLGVPMMVGEKVLGVIATYHPTWSYMFGRDDLEVLQAMASEAAIALDNAKQVQLRIKAEQRAYLADLAQTTAHHLKNEIGSIRPMAEIIVEDADLDLPASYRKSLEMICKNASNAERLVVRLFAPFRDLNLGEIRVDWLISEAVNSVSSRLGEVEIVHSCPQSLPAVYVDRLGTIGVFVELLTNAMEAVGRGSRLGRIDIVGSLSKGEDWIEVQFTNNGPPIPLQLNEVLFEPCKEAETSGFGLGLWSTRVLLEREGGSIHLVKSDEESTTFLIRLPVFR